MSQKVPITLIVDVGGDDSDIWETDFELGTQTVSGIKHAIQQRYQMPVAKQQLYFNNTLLAPDTKTLADCGISKQDMISVAQAQDYASSSRNGGPDPFEQMRLQLLERLRAPGTSAQVRREVPQDLLSAIEDPSLFKQRMLDYRRRVEEANRGNAQNVEAVNNDMSEEGQAKIYENIRQQRVMQEADKIMDDHPELFGKVTMLYINLEVNGHPIKAFVDSGAQATIMSPSCAETCGVTKDIDVRFAGIARGVGTAKILGRVHYVPIKIGDYELPCSFTVMEGKDVDMLLGLDMLKRYQASIDLLNNKLTLGGSASVPFLGESEIPKYFEEAAENEPTVPGPGGTSIGADSGALKPTTSNEPPSSSKPGTNFGGQGRTLGNASMPATENSKPAASTPAQSQGSRQAQPQNPSTTKPAEFPESVIQEVMNIHSRPTREDAVRALRMNQGMAFAAAQFLLEEAGMGFD